MIRIAEVLEDHILEHIIDPAGRDTPQAAEELIEIAHSYLT